MKAIITTILVVASFVLIFSEPSDETNFITTFLWTKTLGFALAYIAYRVGKSDGKLMAKIERLCREAED